MSNMSVESTEQARIDALHSLSILDTPPEEKFDRITKIAQIIFDVPIALVSLVDTNRQWFKSCVGLSVSETPRSVSFCSHAIMNEDIFVIEDATQDERFANNPLVTGDPFIRFYAGKPIHLGDKKLGTLCIIDKQPRKLSKADKSVLSDLAKWLENEFEKIQLTNELKDNTLQLLHAEKQLEEHNQHLENEVKEKTDQLLKQEKITAVGTMASRLAHDLKNPLSVILMVSENLSEKLDSQMDESMKRKCMMLKQATHDISRLIEDTLSFVRTTSLNLSEHSLKELLNNSLHNLDVPDSIFITLPENDISVFCDGEKLKAVFANLILNSVQALENSGNITISAKDEPSKIIIEIMDSGKGIPEDLLPKIFEPLFTTKTSGTGLGLGICKNIVEQHKGKLSFKNNPTTFIIELPKSSQ